MHATALSPPRLLPQARFQRIARLGRALVLFGGTLFLVNAVATWLLPDYALHIIHSQIQVQVDGPLRPLTRVACALWDLPSLAVILGALLQLWRLFGEYLQARVFSARALASLQGFARWVLLGALVEPVYRAGLSVIVTWQNGHGHRQLTLDLSSDDYLVLLLGVVVLAVSRVMAEAARIAEDNEGFV